MRYAPWNLLLGFFIVARSFGAFPVDYGQWVFRMDLDLSEFELLDLPMELVDVPVPAVAEDENVPVAAVAEDEYDPTDYGPQWRMRTFCEARDSRITWPALCRMTQRYYYPGSFSEVEAYCIEALEQRLLQQYIKAFKIGVTSNPWRRWAHEPEPGDSMRGYRAEGFHQLQFLFSTPQRNVVGPMEKQLLLTYRRYDYERGCNTSAGHVLCANLRQGGENAGYGNGPWYLYVAWKFNPGAPELADGPSFVGPESRFEFSRCSTWSD